MSLLAFLLTWALFGWFEVLQSHLSHWPWNKGYHRYCFIPWPTNRNWLWEPIKKETLRQKRLFQFSHSELSIICSPIPTAPVYGVYISRLILYSRACGSYSEFFYRGFLPTRKLLNQGFLLTKLKLSLRNFYDLHHELLNHYGGSQMAKDMFCLFVVITIKYAIHAARK